MSTTYISGPYTSGKLLRDIRAIEDWISDEFRFRGIITAAADQRDMARRVEESSHGRNTVMFDDLGYPSIMVRVPAMRLSDLVSGWPDNLHPAFIVNNVAKSEVWIGKYEASFAGSGATLRAFSLRRRDPGNSINFDNAVLACKQKGAGWHLMTNAEWAAVALWCKKNGFWPRGNNRYGKDYARTGEQGDVSFVYTGSIEGRVATGTGPVAWSHDGSPYGIFDLNGNVWEWVGGLRLNEGEINILPNNDAADNTKDQSATSTQWKAMLQDGSLVAPGTANTLKWDSPNPLTNDGVTQDKGAPILRTGLVNPPDSAWGWGNGYYDYNSQEFELLTADTGVTVPNLLKYLAIFPVDASHGDDRFWIRNYGERLAIRGGDWFYAGSAGVFALALSDPRSHVRTSFGLRPAFVA